MESAAITILAQRAVPSASVESLGLTPLTYAVILALLALIAGMAAATGQRRWVPFALMGAVTLGWLAAFDQERRGLFLPQFYLHSSWVIAYGAGLGALHMAAAAWLTRAGHRLSGLRPWFGLGALIAGALVVASPFLDPALAVLLVWISIGLGLLANLATVRTFERYGFASERFDFAGYALYAAAIILTSTVICLGLLRPETDLAMPTRGAIIAILMLGAAMAFYRIWAMGRERERALTEALAAAEKDAATSRALLEAERNHAIARDLARARADQLVRASHDIRQPLGSLRTTIAAVTADQPSEIRTQLRTAFDYLDDLASGYMKDEADAEPDAQPGEAAPIALMLETLDRMFRADAEDKGLVFVTKPASGDMPAPPMAVMRILSNLVSNAVRHTEAGRIELVGDSHEGRARVTVANTSPVAAGVDPETWFAPREKGAASPGMGLGLAIARQQAQAHGLSLHAELHPGDALSVRMVLSATTSSSKNGGFPP